MCIQFIHSAWLIVQLSVLDIKSVPHNSLSKQEFGELISTRLYPPSVAYSVQCSDLSANTALRCRVEVAGAEAVNGNPPFFELTSLPRASHLQFNPQGNSD